MSITWIKLIVLVCIITSIYPYNFFCIKIYFLCSLTSYTKINSKWIGDLNGSLYTMKLLCLLSRFQSCLTLWFMGSQRVGHDWATELNWPELTLCDSLDCSSPGYSVSGILQARILEWVAMPSFRGSVRHRDGTHVSNVYCIGRQVLYC